VGNTAFVHTHYYSSYSVTHSHPYSKAPDGNPDHTHDKVALDTIAQFNNFAVDLFLFLSIGIISILLLTLVPKCSSSFTLRTVEGNNLRAPPTFY